MESNIWGDGSLRSSNAVYSAIGGSSLNVGFSEDKKYTELDTFV